MASPGDCDKKTRLLCTPAYLGGLRDGFVKCESPLTHLLLDFGVHGLSHRVFFLHHLPFLGVEVLELRSDFQQLVNMRLMFSNGLSQLLGNRGKKIHLFRNLLKAAAYLFHATLQEQRSYLVANSHRGFLDPASAKHMALGSS